MRVLFYNGLRQPASRCGLRSSVFGLPEVLNICSAPCVASLRCTVPGDRVLKLFGFHCSQVDPDGITNALRDPVFHGYIKISLNVEKVTSELSLWSSGCACHEHIRRNISRHTWVTFAKKCTGGRWTSCPLSGCRASELAAGKLHDVMKELWGNVEVDLANVLCSDELASHDHSSQSRIMEAFRASQVAMNGILYEKLAFWTQLPWVLAGVAHKDEEVAVRIARDALQTFDGLSGESDSVHHRITLKLLGPGSGFAGELRAFAAGAATRRECSNSFLIELAKFKFMPVNETAIEGKHAAVTNRSCHIPFGPIRVSLSNRMARFTDGYNREGESWVDSFLVDFEKCRGTSAVPTVLNFDTHPELAEFLNKFKTNNQKGRSGVAVADHQGRKLNHVYRRLATDVMYRCDTRAMYQSLKEQADKNTKSKTKERIEAQKLLASARPAISDRERMLTNLFQIHWMKYGVSGAVFSVKYSTFANAGLVQLGSFVQEPAAKRVKRQRESADEHLPAILDDVDHYTYFSVVQTSSTSGLKKKVRAPIGSASRLGPRHIILSKMKSTNIGGEVYVETMPDFEGTAMDPLLVLDGITSLGPWDAVTDDLKIWDRSGGSLCYCLPGEHGNDAHVKDVCTQLVHRNAYPGGKCKGLPAWSEDQLMAVDWLRHKGFIEDVPQAFGGDERPNEQRM